jgi:hypothetical protein
MVLLEEIQVQDHPQAVSGRAVVVLEVLVHRPVGQEDVAQQPRSYQEWVVMDYNRLSLVLLLIMQEAAVPLVGIMRHQFLDNSHLLVDWEEAEQGQDLVVLSHRASRAPQVLGAVVGRLLTVFLL